MYPWKQKEGNQKEGRKRRDKDRGVDVQRRTVRVKDRESRGQPRKKWGRKRNRENIDIKRHTIFYFT